MINLVFILHSYRRSWQSSHRLNETNVAAADACSACVQNVQRRCDRQTNAIADLQHELGRMPALAEQLSDLLALSGMDYMYIIIIRRFSTITKHLSTSRRIARLFTCVKYDKRV